MIKKQLLYPLLKTIAEKNGTCRRRRRAAFWGVLLNKSTAIDVVRNFIAPPAKLNLLCTKTAQCKDLPYNGNNKPPQFLP